MKRKSKAKAPTLAELEANERKYRSFLEATADHAYGYSLSVPDIETATEDELDEGEIEVEQMIEDAGCLVGDGEGWLDAIRALREAKAKQKQVA